MTLLPITLTVLLGCHDFTGELERIGFVSNLRGAPGAAWTPAHPMAAGTAATLTAATDLSDPEKEEPPLVTGSILKRDDLNATAEAHQLHFTAPMDGRATVLFDGETRDWFRIDFAEARRMSVRPTLDVLFDVPATTPTRLGLVIGAEVPLELGLVDTDGRALGWNPEQLALTPTDAVSLWQPGDGPGRVITHDGAPGEIGAVLADYAGVALDGPELIALTSDDIDDITLHSWVNESDDAWQAVALAVLSRDDMRVLGGGVDWTWSAGELPTDEVLPGDVLALQVPGDVAEVTLTARGGGALETLIIQRPSPTPEPTPAHR